MSSAEVSGVRATGFRGALLISLLLISTVSSFIAVQGWRERLPKTDDFLPMTDARLLVRTGALPERGGLSSFMSYIPPGTTWFWAVGAAITDNPQLTELPGATLLHFGTVLALFLLVRLLLSSSLLALGAAAAYAFSPLGQTFAATLWPRGHPFFSCAVVLCVVLWVKKNQAGYLAGAIALLGAGSYYYLELAPLAIVLISAAFFFRPPIRLLSVAVGFAVVLAIWAPYLRWDSKQDFRNVISSVTRKSHVNPSDSHIPWCKPQTPFVSVSASGTQTPFHFVASEYYPEQEKLPDSPVGRIAKRLAKDFLIRYVQGFLTNFTGALLFPVAGAFLAGIVLGSLWICAVSASRGKAHPNLTRLYPWIVCGGGCLALTLLVLTYRVARHNPALQSNALQTLVNSGLQVAAACAGALILPRLFAAIGSAERSHSSLRLCAICVAPAMLTVLIAERGHANRLWWLWPLEIVLLFFPAASLRRTTSRAIFSALIIAVMAANSQVASHLEDLRLNGFSGKPNALATLLNQAATLAGSREFSIGYQFPFQRWEPPYSAADSRYRAGMEADLYLLLRDGAVNSDHCAEGLSDSDRFRIVETRPQNPEGFDAILALAPMDGYQRISCDGTLCLYARP